MRSRQARPGILRTGLGTRGCLRALGGLGTLALVLGLAARAAADTALASPSCPDASLIATSDNLERIDEAVFCLLNAQRQQQGARPFNRRSQLDQSASFQSADMVAHHFFAHDYPGRPSLLDRVLWTGYFDGAVTGLYAENLGNGPQQTTTPSVMVDAWMSSPDHRANILDPRLHDVGLGDSLAPPDPAFYPDRSSLVVTTDFGVRVFRGRCGAQPRSSGQRDAAAAPERRVCRRRSRRRHG